MKQYVTSTRPADQTALEEYIHSIGDVHELRPGYHEHTWQIISDPASEVEAVIGASHFQFLAYKSLLEQITPFPVTYGLNRKDDYHIISRIDQLGYLQLSTPNPYVYHMGNVPDDITLEDVRRDGVKDIFMDNPAITVTDQHDHRSWRKNIALKALRSFSSVGVFRDLLLRIYNLLFEHFTSAK